MELWISTDKKDADNIYIFVAKDRYEAIENAMWYFGFNKDEDQRDFLYNYLLNPIGRGYNKATGKSYEVHLEEEK